MSGEKKGVIDCLQEGWDIIEQALLEAGITGPPTNTDLSFDSRAEQVAKAIVARLANNDPPILLAYGHELREEDTT